MNRARPSMRVGGRSPTPMEVIAPDRVTDSELWLLLLSSVRYGLGRSSYIVDDICNMVVKFRGRLKPEQLDQLRREINTELNRCESLDGTCGMQMDHERWKRLLGQLA